MKILLYPHRRVTYLSQLPEPLRKWVNDGDFVYSTAIYREDIKNPHKYFSGALYVQSKVNEPIEKMIESLSRQLSDYVIRGHSDGFLVIRYSEEIRKKVGDELRNFIVGQTIEDLTNEDYQKVVDIVTKIS